MILLSFDTEEFDLPKEHGVDIALPESMQVSIDGVNKVLDILEKEDVKATFFCTTTFAKNAPQVMKRIISGGHEVASHGCDHTNPEPSDIARSKKELESLYPSITIRGYRQPRMFAVDNDSLVKSGYSYNSSMHPAFIPGRYMHLNQPRTPFVEDGLLQIPASVSPWFRLPIFWLACHNYPFALYKALCRWTWKHDGQLVLYFHPWEFIDLSSNPDWRVPFIIKRNSGEGMEKRLTSLIRMFKSMDAKFVTYTRFTSGYIK
jgi:hypothetical protein